MNYVNMLKTITLIAIGLSLVFTNIISPSEFTRTAAAQSGNLIECSEVDNYNGRDFRTLDFQIYETGTYTDIYIRETIYDESLCNNNPDLCNGQQTLQLCSRATIENNIVYHQTGNIIQPYTLSEFQTDWWRDSECLQNYLSAQLPVQPGYSTSITGPFGSIANLPEVLHRGLFYPAVENLQDMPLFATAQEIAPEAWGVENETGAERDIQFIITAESLNTLSQQPDVNFDNLNGYFPDDENKTFLELVAILDRQMPNNVQPVLSTTLSDLIDISTEEIGGPDVYYINQGSSGHIAYINEVNLYIIWIEVLPLEDGDFKFIVTLTNLELAIDGGGPVTGSSMGSEFDLRDLAGSEWEIINEPDEQSDYMLLVLQLDRDQFQQAPALLNGTFENYFHIMETQNNPNNQNRPTIIRDEYWWAPTCDPEQFPPTD